MFVDSVHAVLIVFMAVDTGKDIVVGGQVAFVAGPAGVGARIQGKIVIENRLRPGQVIGEVTVFALGRKTG
jgi:predicted transcriptional regulator